MNLIFSILILVVAAGCKLQQQSQNDKATKERYVILLDQYFNNEWKKDKADTLVRYHYTWEDKSNSGFSMFGNLFTTHGAETKTLFDAPTAYNLKSADVYAIVDPDTEKETEKPNYIRGKDIDEIKNWVKTGGVLVLMGNDSGNAEFTHFNQLAGTFGIQFNEDSKNRVLNNQYEQGAIVVPANHAILTKAKKLFIKEYSSLSVKKPAETVLMNGKDNVMAVSRYGKGIVFAIGDPWLYNEYTDGKKLPAEYENYKAAEDLVLWLLKQASKKSKNS